MAQTTVNIRMDAELKEDFARLMDELGLSMSAGFNVFAKAAVRCWGIPFEMKGERLNDETLQVINDAEAGHNVAGPFDSMSELMDYLNA